MPKALRDALDVKAGQELDIQFRDGRLEIQVMPTAMRLARRGASVVAIPDKPLPPLTAAKVRAILEQTRR